MKAVAERAAKTVSRTPASKAGTFFAAVPPKLTVNAPGDKHEKEAESTADRILRMPSAPSEEKPAPRATEREPDRIQRTERLERERVQRSESGTPVVSEAVHSGIRGQETGGHALDAGMKQFMESRFATDFGSVRVHHDAEAGRLSNQLAARAFTKGSHIFFAADQYRPESSEGKHLLAHELTHTIQQGAAVQRSPRVGTGSATPAIQRLGLGDALSYFADKANFLPGFRLLTIILGFNPINMSSVDRSASNILRALIELLPGGTLVSAALASYGIFERAGAFVAQQLSAFAGVGAQIKRGISAFLDSLSWRDIFDLGGVWDRAKAIFTTPITSLIDFGKGLLTGLMDLVRDAVLRPLAEALRPTRGYDLLCAVLGRDPVTGGAVPRTAETLIGGFMKLIGREDIWDNIKKGNAMSRAWAWFQGALSGLLGFVTSIPGRVTATLRSITWQDVVTITGVVGKVLGLFASLAGQFFGWASGTVMELLEIVFSVVAPGVIQYVKKAQGAFRTILDNPIGFVGNLVRAGRAGFELFGRNILEHLKTALIKWIVGPLADAGVYIPKSFDLIEIIKLVLSILGLTWQNVRAKLVKIIPEPVLVVLEKTASILVTLVTEGPVAAWEQIKAELSELKSMLIAEVTNMVVTQVVQAAVTKIVSMINPAGAVIQAIIAIYNTIMFFVERISQIAATVAAFVDSIAAIAAGQVTAAAQKVEQTLANTLVVVISFLARLVGLGGVPQKIVAIIQKIRKPIDKGLDRIVAWLGALLNKLKAAAKSAAARFMDWWKKKVPVTGDDEPHTLTFQGERRAAQLTVMSEPSRPAVFLTKKAQQKNIPTAESKGPIDTCEKQASAIAETQTSLAKYDDPSKPVASGADAKVADSLAGTLIKQLDELAAHVGSTLLTWKAGDAEVKSISVPRKRFDYEMKVAIAEAHADKSDLARDKKTGENINLKKSRKLARRHIVSSHDIADHYERAIKGKQVSRVKLLLEESGTAPGARAPLPKATVPAVVEAANARHERFFGYTRNIFIGDSRENSRIRQYLDAGGFPEGATQMLDEHVSFIKRGWALDSSILITGVDRG